MFVPNEVFIKDDTQVLKPSNTLYRRPIALKQTLLASTGRKGKSFSLEQYLNLLPCQHALWPWADRCSFEDSCEHQKTLRSSPDCKHLESRKQPCNIASQLSFLYQLNVILPWTRAVISPPTLTRFWYRRAYHVFNGFKGGSTVKSVIFRWFPPFFLYI